MLHYIQKVSLQNRNDPILRDGWVIMGTGINTPKCHHRLSLEVRCGWFSSFLSFSLLFIRIFYFFFSCSEHVFLLSFKKLKIINKMPPPRPTHHRQAVTMGGCPSTITTALPAEHNQRETMFSWGSLGHSHPTPHHSMEEVQRTILKNSETHSAGPGYLATTEAQGPGRVQQSGGEVGELKGRWLDSG